MACKDLAVGVECASGPGSLLGNLDEANSDVEQLRMEVDAAQLKLKSKQSEAEELAAELEKTKQAAAQVDQLTADRDTAQSNLETTAIELAKAKEATEQANAKATELDETAAHIAKDAKAERSKLQAALDQANAEIERLKIELQQEKAVPSPNGI